MLGLPIDTVLSNKIAQAYILVQPKLEEYLDVHASNIIYARKENSPSDINDFFYFIALMIIHDDEQSWEVNIGVDLEYDWEEVRKYFHLKHNYDINPVLEIFIPEDDEDSDSLFGSDINFLNLNNLIQ